MKKQLAWIEQKFFKGRISAAKAATGWQTFWPARTPEICEIHEILL